MDETHALGAATVCTMLATARIARTSTQDSYDQVVLALAVGLQAALLASLYLPLPVGARAALGSLSHLGFVTGLVYGAVAGSRPLLLLTTLLLVGTLVSRAVVKGCLFSVAEYPQAGGVKRRASLDGDWQLLGVLSLGLLRLLIGWTPPKGAQAGLALVCCVATAHLLA